MSYLNHINACNRWNKADFLPWGIGGEILGWMRQDFAKIVVGLAAITFPAQHRFALEGAGLGLEMLDWKVADLDPKIRDARLSGLCETLQVCDTLPPPLGERYAVTAGRRDQAKCTIDRAHAPYFGTRAFGQHLNGFVRSAQGLELWVARRAPDRHHYPNRLDNMVAGGLPHGVALRENLRKECFEEAGLSAAIADQARPVGAISYCRESRAGLKPDLMYCYDLELPPELTPVCTDGEVAAFERWPIEQVMQTVSDSEDFKLNCNLVIIDFLIRHGYITPDDPDYFELVSRLRSPLSG
jgi:8-oxo-dGTP pyrophosphatase MutT (NUDIX family)